MRTYLIFFAFIFSFSINAQKNIEAKELTRKEIRQLKKQKAFEKQKARYEYYCEPCLEHEELPM